MMKWFRENVYVAGLLLILRVYVGWTWFDAGLHKVTGGFDAGGFLNNAVANPVLDKGTGEALYPTYLAFLEGFAVPNINLINIMIPWGELLVGLGLLLGALTTAAAFFGLMMNFMFLFAGTVSTNPWLVLLGTIIFIAGANAGKFGADYYLLPYMKKWVKGIFNNKNKPATPATPTNTKTA